MTRGSLKDFMGTLAERFERNTMPEPNSGCLLWVGAAKTGGYGVIRDGKKQATATHVALRLAGKEVPIGMYVLHRCDNPSCINVDHLFIGTLKENTADAIAKGRHKGCIVKPGSKAGEKNGKARLTDAQVLEIRRLYSANRGIRYVARGSLAKLAAEFGVSPSTILKAATGRAWRHVSATMQAGGQ